MAVAGGSEFLKFREVAGGSHGGSRKFQDLSLPLLTLSRPLTHRTNVNALITERRSSFSQEKSTYPSSDGWSDGLPQTYVSWPTGVWIPSTKYETTVLQFPCWLRTYRGCRHGHGLNSKVRSFIHLRLQMQMNVTKVGPAKLTTFRVSLHFSSRPYRFGGRQLPQRWRGERLMKGTPYRLYLRYRK